jgi:DNA-binding NtrC family response regulator
MNYAAPSPPTVLVVDDEPMIRQLIGCFLRSRNVSVVEAADGDAALRLTREERVRPDLAILDIVMPGVGGVALLEELRKDDPDLPVLLVSGFCDDPGAVDRAIDDQTRFLAKPFNFKMLEVELKRLLPPPPFAPSCLPPPGLARPQRAIRHKQR